MEYVTGLQGPSTQQAPKQTLLSSHLAPVLPARLLRATLLENLLAPITTALLLWASHRCRALGTHAALHALRGVGSTLQHWARV